MSGRTVKEKILETIQSFPEDTSLKDATRDSCFWRRSSAGQRNRMPERASITPRRNDDSSGDASHLGTSGGRGCIGDTGLTWRGTRFNTAISPT